VRWKILFYRILQFICESKSERIIEIGPHLPKLSQKLKWHLFMAHGVVVITHHGIRVFMFSELSRSRVFH